MLACNVELEYMVNVVTVSLPFQSGTPGRLLES
jgi:hypothetical protein